MDGRMPRGTTFHDRFFKQVYKNCGMKDVVLKDLKYNTLNMLGDSNLESKPI